MIPMVLMQDDMNSHLCFHCQIHTYLSRKIPKRIVSLGILRGDLLQKCRILLIRLQYIKITMNQSIKGALIYRNPK